MLLMLRLSHAEAAAALSRLWESGDADAGGRKLPPSLP